LTSPRPTHPANCLRSPSVQQPLFSVATLCGPTPSADAKGDWLRVPEVPVSLGRSLLLTLFDRPQNAQTAIWPRLNSRPNRHLCQTGPLLLNNPFSHSHPRPTSHPIPPRPVQQSRRREERTTDSTDGHGRIAVQVLLIRGIRVIRGFSRSGAPASRRAVGRLSSRPTQHPWRETQDGSETRPTSRKRQPRRPGIVPVGQVANLPHSVRPSGTGVLPYCRPAAAG